MIRVLALALSLLVPALAQAEAVFPPGSRIGLAPRKDMEFSRRFTGFEDPGKGATVTFVEMPPEAYAQIAASMTAEALKGQGVAVKGREDTKVAGNDAVVVTGEQSQGSLTIRKWLVVAKEPTLTALVIAQAPANAAGYGDAEMRGLLKTIALRPPLPIQEQIASLPFKVGELAGFRAVRAMAGNSLLLTEGPKDVIRDNEQPLLIIAQSLTPPPRAEQRAEFARSALYSNATMKDLIVERSQGFRQRGADWHEIVARGQDKETGRPLVVAQTIRFAPDGYVRMVGIARADTRDAILPRFRNVIDSVDVIDGR
ncbi:MAG TPA: hypothetical protein VIL65_09330 [Beijerinckiaceae bacterium]|jgi:hypothetical protein